MPTPSIIKAACWGVLVVVLLSLALNALDRLRASETGPAVRTGVSQPERELVRVDSVTGHRLGCIPTDLTSGCIPYTDTLP